MKFIYKLSLKLKLLLLLLLLLLLFPVGGLLVFSTLQTFNNYKSYNEMQRLEGIALTTSVIASFVHETDRERGMTSIFMGSEGEEFKKELKKQRLQTDSSYKALVQTINNADLKSFPKSFQKNVLLAINTFKNINKNRKEVDILKIRLEIALRFYTDINAKLLDEVVKLSQISRDPKITQDILAYSNLLSKFKS